MNTETREAPTRYLQLAEELRHQMRLGVLKPGDRLPSFAEMRARGISQNTMEKVHALLEREHLVERRHRAGVFVASARERKPQTGIIGVAGQGFTFREYSPYWVSLLRGIREVADAAEKQILLLDHLSNKGWEKADGVLVCDWSNQLTMQWLPPQMPCVSLLVPCDGMVSVYADDYQGGRFVTEYLLKLGHRRIAHLHSFDPFVSGKRLAGYRDALLHAGVTPREEWSRNLEGKYDYGVHFEERGREAMRAWLKDGWNNTGCTAIIAQNDDTAFGVIAALKEAGLQVPDDVNVIGFDAVESTQRRSPSLTTVEVPLEEIGRAATKLLLRQLENEDVGPHHRVFPVALREGQSTAAVSIN